MTATDNSGFARARLTACVVALIALGGAAWSAADTSNEIRRVETGLVRKVQVKGEPVHKFTIAERLEHYKVPGASVAVVSDGKLSWAGRCGDDQWRYRERSRRRNLVLHCGDV